MDVQNDIVNVYSHVKHEIYYRNKKLLTDLNIGIDYFNYDIYYEGDPTIPLKTKIFCGNIRVNYEFINQNHRLSYEWRGDFAKEALFLILSDMNIMNYFSFKNFEKTGNGITYMIYNGIKHKKNLEFNKLPLWLGKEILDMTEIGHVGVILPFSPECINFFETINRLKDYRNYINKEEAELMWEKEVRLAKNKNRLCLLCEQSPKYLPYLYFRDELEKMGITSLPEYK